MFNNVILDVAIGIVFIFLLYSLLATSLQEAIATIIALRARTLKNGIVNSMLCNTPDISKLESIWNGISSAFKEIGFFFYKPPLADADKKLGHLFYDHPLIKNYGSSPVFPNPSYIPGDNFSTVLIDVLKDDFNGKLDLIAASKVKRQTGSLTLAQVTENLKNSPDILKIKELLVYYQALYADYDPKIKAWELSGRNKADKPLLDAATRIEKETLTILLMHFNNSAFQLDAFSKKLESWFDDTMNRVSGWYKRRTQFILFAIGITLAILLNIDIIQMSGKLSTDKEARSELVQMAIKQADAYKDDPRVKGNKSDALTSDSLKKISDEYQKHIAEAKKTIDSGIVKANQLLALGWGDYGMKQDSGQIMNQYFIQHGPPLSSLGGVSLNNLFKNATGEAKYRQASADSLLDLLAYGADSLRKSIAQKLTDTSIKHRVTFGNAAVMALLDTFKKEYTWPVEKVPDGPFLKFKDRYKALKNELVLEDEYGYLHKTTYVFSQFTATKLMGFLLTAFAISLGAPFWFDLLNKLIRLRAAGKKEDGDNGDTGKGKAATPSPAVNINLNNPSAPGEEAAVG